MQYCATSHRVLLAIYLFWPFLSTSVCSKVRNETPVVNKVLSGGYPSFRYISCKLTANDESIDGSIRPIQIA